MQKQSYVKCQILVGDVERDVIRKISRLRQPYFDEVIEKIKKLSFNYPLHSLSAPGKLRGFFCALFFY